MAIRIYSLLIIIFIVLLSILFLFRPISEKESSKKDVPQLEIKNFKLYEVDQLSVKTMASAPRALKYKDRYKLYNLLLKQKANKQSTTIRAKYGVYKNHCIHVEGGVIVSRDDGVEFKSDEADFNQTSQIITTQKKFTFSQKNNSFSGANLLYRIKDKSIKATNIVGIYNYVKGNND